MLEHHQIQINENQMVNKSQMVDELVQSLIEFEFCFLLSENEKKLYQVDESQKVIQTIIQM